MSWKNDQVSESETQKILELARGQLNSDGDFVEFGCYAGDTSILLAEILRNSSHKLYLYDSFDGLPEKTAADQSEIGKDFQKGALFTTKTDLKKRFLRANLPVPIIKKAWFSDLNPVTDLPSKISFAFLDGDFYDSIKTSLTLVLPKMSANSVLLIHDYNNPALPGVAKAVHEALPETLLQFACVYGTILIIQKKLALDACKC